MDEVTCGEDFCVECGDCLACYGNDPCYSGTGCFEGCEHVWPLKETKEEDDERK